MLSKLCFRSRPRLSDLRYTYSGFGGVYQSECMPGAVPFRQNSPRKPPYGLFPELVSGTGFTVPKAKNRFSWLYRISPSVAAGPFQVDPYATPSGAFPFVQAPVGSVYVPEPIHVLVKSSTSPLTGSSPHSKAGPSIHQVRADSTDFVDGMMAVGGNSTGVAGLYSVSSGREPRYFRNNDAEMLLLPYEGAILVETEFGKLEVSPWEVCVVPRGVVMRISCLSGSSLDSSGSGAKPSPHDPVSRGYFLENFGAPLVIPDFGPIGVSSCMVQPRHWLAPTAVTDERKSPLVCKANNQLFIGTPNRSLFDVVGWYGSHVPLKYDLRNYAAVNSVSFDHPDPSIGAVLQSQTAESGLSAIDFVVFPPRWIVAENTFRPPWFHRNFMSEFMGLIAGEYEAKAETLTKGSCTIHNQFVPHGPDGDAVDAGSEDTDAPSKVSNTLAFMFESKEPWLVSQVASRYLDPEYVTRSWGSIRPRFNPEDLPTPEPKY